MRRRALQILTGSDWFFDRRSLFCKSVLSCLQFAGGALIVSDPLFYLALVVVGACWALLHSIH